MWLIGHISRLMLHFSKAPAGTELNSIQGDIDAWS